MPKNIDDDIVVTEPLKSTLSPGTILAVWWRYYPADHEYAEVDCPGCSTLRYYKFSNFTRGRATGSYACECGYAWPEWELTDFPLEPKR